MGKITYLSSVNVLMAPQGYLLIVTAEITHEKKKEQVEHVLIALARSPALLAHLHLQLPSMRHIVGMWDSVYRKSEVKNMFGRLLQVNGQDFKKGEDDTSKEHFVDPCGKDTSSVTENMLV